MHKEVAIVNKRNVTNKTRSLEAYTVGENPNIDADATAPTNNAGSIKLKMLLSLDITSGINISIDIINAKIILPNDK